MRLRRRRSVHVVILSWRGGSGIARCGEREDGVVITSRRVWGSVLCQVDDAEVRQATSAS